MGHHVHVQESRLGKLLLIASVQLKAESNEAIYLDDKQAIRLLELMEDQPIYYRTAVTVLLFTGMRRGELMGLRWSDIDFENNLITIERSL